MAKPHRQHLKSSKDLETTYEAIRAGFVALALERNRRATPFVAEARALRAAAGKAKTPADLLGIKEIKQGLLAAAGVSDKAAGHLGDRDKREVIEGLIANFLEPAGGQFVEELVFRFLLTRGDTLGGSMRNVGGFLAQKKLTRCVIAALRLAGRRCQWLGGGTGTWGALPDDNADVELNLRGLSWVNPRGQRTLLYNLKVPCVGNNIDLSLIQGAVLSTRSESIRAPEAYVALGELKGGIDPAGADEHWKTARTALHRITQAFERRKHKSHTFFVGAAIEPKMAKESGPCSKAVNWKTRPKLTNDDQIAAVAGWLCNL